LATEDSASAAEPKPIYETYPKVPNLFVLCIFSDATRMAHVMRRTQAHATYPSQFRFKTIAPVDPLLNAATLPQLVTEPWQRIGGTFNRASRNLRKTICGSLHGPDV
jgi:hypothetical protein